MLESLSFAETFCTCEFSSTHKTRSCSPPAKPSSACSAEMVLVRRTGPGSRAFPGGMSLPIPNPAHLRPPARPIVPSTPRLMTGAVVAGRPSGVSPDNGFWGRLEPRSPPARPPPPQRRLQATRHLPAGTGTVGGGWQPGRGESGSCPCAGARGDLGKGGRAGRGGLSTDTVCPLFTAFNNKAVAIATGLINASHLHN